MREPPPKQVLPFDLHCTLLFAVKRALRPIMGKRGDHEAAAQKVVDAIVAHLQLCGWTVWCRPRKGHSTPGPRREE
jgi:hypothetical protein